ncbi:hypothetical protein H671_2g6059 [Cricetulus griseus]|nr:hypothetical protein H671_2g6059 [Cricetulus griseus]
MSSSRRESWRYHGFGSAGQAPSLLKQLIDGIDVEFVYMVGYIDGFSYVKPSLHPWDEAYLIIVDDFSDMFLDSIPNILLSISASIFMRDIGL